MDIRTLHDKLSGYTKPNSVYAARQLELLEADDIDVSEALDLISDYQGLERSDYDEAEDFSEARAEGWEDILSAIDEIADAQDEE